MPYQALHVSTPAEFKNSETAIEDHQFARNNRLFTIGTILAALAAVGAATILSFL